MWTAIIGAVAGIVSGILNYSSNQSAQGQAKDIAAQNRQDVLAQASIENKQKQQELTDAEAKTGFDERSALVKQQQGQQQQQTANISAEQKAVVDKVNQSAQARQQLLQLWK